MAQNVLGRQFDPEAANEAWVADITYIPTREGWLYLAVVEDLYSRRVVGWSMADDLESRLNDLDNDAVKAVESGDEASFIALFRRMVDLVRAEGEELPADDLSPSDVILPPPDTTLAEAAAEFTGEGLVPERR